MDKTYGALIQSSRVSSVTRDVLQARAQPDDPDYVPSALDEATLETLRVVLDLVIPQSPPRTVDLAARIDRTLSRGVGDGWRYSALPADRDAYVSGVRTLNGLAVRRFGNAFAEVSPEHRQVLLTHITMGPDAADTTSGDGLPLDPAQLRLWFEELRADAVRLFVATPAMLARIGYSGIANGGDGLPKSGFVDVGLNQREDWEPSPAGIASDAEP